MSITFKNPFAHLQLHYLSLFLVLAFFLLSSCGEKKEKTQTPEGTISFDLSPFGKPFSIFVPDTSKTPVHITEQSSGALEITSGPNFGIVINEQFTDLNQVREDLKADDVNKLTAFITDEPTALYWESAIVQPEYHFYLNKKIQNSEYSFEDLKSTEKETFPKESVKRMFDLCRKLESDK